MSTPLIRWKVFLVEKEEIFVKQFKYKRLVGPLLLPPEKTTFWLSDQQKTCWSYFSLSTRVRAFISLALVVVLVLHNY